MAIFPMTLHRVFEHWCGSINYSTVLRPSFCIHFYCVFFVAHRSRIVQLCVFKKLAP